MIWTLLRLDGTLRGFWAPVAFGVLGGLFLRNLAVPLPSDLSSLSANARGWLHFTLGVVWFSCLMILLFNVAFQARTSRFFLGLPIRAVRLWWIRVGTVLAATTLPVVLGALIVAARFPTESLLPVFEPFYLLLAARAVSGLILSTFLYMSPWPSLVQVPYRSLYIGYVILVSVLVLVFVLISPTGLFLTLFMTAIAVALAIRLHRSIPEAFLVHPTEVGDEEWGVRDEPLVSGTISAWDPEDRLGSRATGGIAGAAEQRIGTTGRESYPEAGPEVTGRVRTVHLVLFQALVNHWHFWVFAPITALYAVLLWDGYYAGKNPFVNILFLTTWPYILGYQGVIRLYRVDHLPISRRLLFSYVAVSSLMPVVIGAVLGSILIPRHETPCHICYSAGGAQVPPEFWEITWTGQPPTIRAPWGESYQPRLHEIFPGSRIAVYSPYETSGNLSVRFQAFQLNRALEDVHGEAPYSEEQIAEFSVERPLFPSLLSGDTLMGVRPVEASLGRSSELHQRTWLLGCIAVILVGMVIGCFWLLQFWPSAFNRWFRVVFLVLEGIWGGFLMVQLLGAMQVTLDPIASGRAVLILLRQTVEKTSAGPEALWLGVLLSAGCLYLLLQFLFGRIEAPLGKVKKVWRD